MFRRLLLSSALVLATLVAPSATASNAAITISFEKERQADGSYEGSTADGGTIRMWVYDSRFVGDVQHFTTTLELTYPDRSLTAVLDGHFDGGTLSVTLNGEVVDGWLEGARVHEESTLVAFSPLTFAGTVKLMPASAGNRS